MHSITRFAPFAVYLCAATPTFAQGPLNSLPAPIEVRVSINLSTLAFLDAGDPSKSIAAQTDARKSLYELIGRECGLLTQTIARQCRIESISVNSNIQANREYGMPMPVRNSTVQVGASANFRVILRDAGEPN
jgi:hypothetical protein